MPFVSLFPGGGGGFLGGNGFGGFPAVTGEGGFPDLLKEGADLLKFLLGRNGGNGGIDPTTGGPGPVLGPLAPPTGGNGAGLAGGVTCITPRLSLSRRLPARVDVPVLDSSGNVKFTTYKNMGRAVLFQGDFAAAKRVRRVAARAHRATPHHYHARGGK